MMHARVTDDSYDDLMRAQEWRDRRADLDETIADSLRCLI